MGGKTSILWLHYVYLKGYPAYLIFVASINSGASVKFIDWGEFFHSQRKKDFWQCTFVHSVLFHTQCVILLTVCNLTPIV